VNITCNFQVPVTVELLCGRLRVSLVSGDRLITEIVRRASIKTRELSLTVLYI
jgi:hypothetical protein